MAYRAGEGTHQESEQAVQELSRPVRGTCTLCDPVFHADASGPASLSLSRIEDMLAPVARPAARKCLPNRMVSGAGDGNRTRIASLEGWGSAIELHPRAPPAASPARNHMSRPLDCSGRPWCSVPACEANGGRGVAQLGSALALGARSRGFKSPLPDRRSGGVRPFRSHPSVCLWEPVREPCQLVRSPVPLSPGPADQPRLPSVTHSASSSESAGVSPAAASSWRCSTSRRSRSRLL